MGNTKQPDMMMTFGIDKQTSLDLNIFPQTKGELSLFGYYNQTQTKGGEETLANMMRMPLNDLQEINSRISTISYIAENNFTCKLNRQHIDFVEYYLKQNTTIINNNSFDSFLCWISNKIRPKNEYYVISKGLEYLKIHLKILSDFLDKINPNTTPIFFQVLKNEIDEIYDTTEFKHFLASKESHFTYRQLIRYDSLIRKKEKERIKNILNLTYLLDTYISLALTLKKNTLSFPVFIEATEPIFKIDSIFHPLINHPVKNDVALIQNKNLCFISGANMAGKSTFLKSVGLCVYLSHLGFPVPAKSMKTTLFNGLYTTINIPDDINKGYSHYYSEVKRVKDITLMLKEKKKLFVIFDELFRGTNVKDAYDGTLLITNGFAQIKHSLFYISSHITEVGQELEKSNKVFFKCFESKLNGEQPVYNYKLIDGISSERLGIVILKNEGILEMIDEIIKEETDQ